MKKWCNGCQRNRPTRRFNRRGPNGLQSKCKDCQAEHRRRNQAKYNEYLREHRKRNPTASADYMFLRNLGKLYGITYEEYEAILDAQGHRCAICNELFVKRPHIDHDHSTGEVRGLLCLNCNNGLGRFKDDIERLRAAIRYLKR